MEIKQRVERASNRASTHLLKEPATHLKESVLTCPFAVFALYFLCSATKKAVFVKNDVAIH